MSLRKALSLATRRMFAGALAAVLLAAGAGPARASAQASPAAATVDKPKLEVVPTALVARDGATAKRIVRLLVDVPGDIKAEAAVKAWIGGKAVVPEPGAFPLGPGKNGLDVRLPEPAKPVKARFEVRFAAASGHVALDREITLAPARPWSVYLFHHSHTDIGYTELQSRVAKNHVEYLDSVIKYCRETDAYPEDAKFRWNIEISWALENFIRSCTKKTIDET